MVFKIGDKVIIKHSSDNHINTEWDSNIPDAKHGTIMLSATPNAYVTGFYNSYVVVEYTDKNDTQVRLGFYPEGLTLEYICWKSKLSGGK